MLFMCQEFLTQWPLSYLASSGTNAVSWHWRQNSEEFHKMFGMDTWPFICFLECKEGQSQTGRQQLAFHGTRSGEVVCGPRYAVILDFTEGSPVCQAG